ncbi:AP endonuclease [Calocera cornea HHB12733]|uniref:Apurinic-apyrimidinic endonuclease 1 n=1 Tax=Calocera cornea HHB12733 TaxID=1353952 RepID=A0A165CQ00_9BASI|nr:AP endonuclease [Calocera cornea HHB12733]
MKLHKQASHHIIGPGDARRVRQRDSDRAHRPARQPMLRASTVLRSALLVRPARILGNLPALPRARHYRTMPAPTRRRSLKAGVDTTIVAAAASAVTTEVKRGARRLSTTRAALAEVKLKVKEEEEEEEESDLTDLEEEEEEKPAKKRVRRAAPAAKSPKATKVAKAAKTKSMKAEEEDALKEKKAVKGKAKKAMEEPEVKERVKSEICVGAHVSAAGGVENAVLNAASIGANAFALFLKSQRKWSSPPLTEDSISLFKARMTKYGYDAGMVLPHGSYLINLGNPDANKREKAYECFLDDLQRCEQLGIKLYNFHPGSTVGGAPLEECLAYVAESINRAHKATSHVCVVIENMAGAGNVMGCRFSDLATMISLVEDKARVGVCLDTCHLFASGYDIRDKAAYRATMEEFDKVVGFKYLKAWHLNDSKTPLNSKKDRHENLGLGHIGLPTFSHIMTDPRLAHMPMVLETPSFEQQTVWGREIEILYSFEQEHKAEATIDWNAKKGEVQKIVKWAEGQGKKPSKAGGKRKKGADEDEEHECGSD